MSYERKPDANCPVWAVAALCERDYITPEDVTCALAGGADLRAVERAVLVAVDIKRAEDASLCAYLVLSHTVAEVAGEVES